jgi:4-diphosphocytidyl-2-C-methyl-D-erythritol kinase
LTRLEPVLVEAHAKVNLTLEILGKRDDGYHNLVTVMQTIDLFDSIELTPAGDLTLECDAPALAAESNLAFRAASALRHAARVRDGVRLRLAKRIPVAAGLGGGSSDAAAVLLALNTLWHLDWPVARLQELAIDLGADVPFFLHGGAALVQGRGDEVVPLPPPAIDWLVVLAPDIELAGKTGRLFSMVTPDLYTRGVLSHKLAGRIRGGGDTPAEFMFNAFGQLASKAFPDLDRYRTAFEAIGAREIVLCGAGPSMFALAPSREIGLAWQLLLKGRGMRAYLVRRWTPRGGARHKATRSP